MSRPTLYSIAYSPWSLRARLALDLAGKPYDKHEYLPTLGEPALRLRLRRPLGRVTLPVMFLPDGTALTDSLDIARHALGDSALWGDEGDVQHWTAWSERMLAAGRVRTTRSVMQDPAALENSLPGPIRSLGPLGMAIGRQAAGMLLRKYPIDAESDATLAEGLDELDDALSTRRWLGGDQLTWSDVTAAVGLCFVDPPMTLPLGKAARPHWRHDALATEHADAIRWRDRVLRTCAERAAG